MRVHACHCGSRFHLEPNGDLIPPSSLFTRGWVLSRPLRTCCPRFVRSPDRVGSALRYDGASPRGGPVTTIRRFSSRLGQVPLWASMMCFGHHPDGRALRWGPFNRLGGWVVEPLASAHSFGVLWDRGYEHSLIVPSSPCPFGAALSCPSTPSLSF